MLDEPTAVVAFGAYQAPAVGVRTSLDNGNQRTPGPPEPWVFLLAQRAKSLFTARVFAEYGGHDSRETGSTGAFSFGQGAVGVAQADLGSATPGGTRMN